MDAIENLLSWAQTQGITVSNVGPRALPGRGIGIVVTSPLKKDDTILDVPIPCLKTIATTPKPLTRPFPKETHVHALLALDIALDASPSFKTWSAVFPTPQDLSSCPLTWSASSPTRRPSPPSPPKPSPSQSPAREIESHWSSSLHAPPRPRRQTHVRVLPPRLAPRELAHILPRHTQNRKTPPRRPHDPPTRRRPPQPRLPRLLNDFLLVEYGFVMNQGENEWDEVCIDDLLLPRLGAAHRRRLEERGFLGNYVIDAETVCYRTQVALRTLVLPARRWAQFVDGFSDGEAEQPEVDALLREMLSAYNEEIESKIETVRGLDEGQQFQRDMVVARWKQIQLLVRGTIDKLKASNTQ
ncbi:SET domain-containing protein [Colletotrichum scovillei]|uniref:SET domain-containing protein n=1 Tax=Colletotrichum scovillei TaxID=1209932 RepID=UPI0015C3CE6E|nr:SET domain-containing protein [Colletotrichum scovillei]KAF4772822.1 SET domain-containing protein [Colletotrichum scovillei]